MLFSRTLHNRRLFVSRYTFITQTNYCSMSTESHDDHIRSLISNSLGELTTNIAAVVDNRLSEFKRQLEESQDETAETSTAKRMKLMQQPLIKSDGNKQQFQHELNVLGKDGRSLQCTRSTQIRQSTNQSKRCQKVSSLLSFA